jgi:hypothetical protein
MAQTKSDRTVSLTVARTFAAPRDRLFQAWTEPQALLTWWAAGPELAPALAEVDLRVGGRYRLGMRVRRGRCPRPPSPGLAGMPGEPTMKTPTALYLAYRGWFAANVPIVPGIAPPPELLALPARRVVCLIMSPARLRDLRLARAGELGAAAEAYTSLVSIREEIRHCQHLAAKHRWREVDVTSKSVEEAAREIATLLPKESTAAGARFP